MILGQGDKVLIVHRRLYQGDECRYFVGEVDGYDAGVAKVTGVTWARDRQDGGMTPKRGRRTKLISLQSGTLIVYHLPRQTAIDQIRFEEDASLNCRITDGRTLDLDLTESVHTATV